MNSKYLTGSVVDSPVAIVLSEDGERRMARLLILTGECILRERRDIHCFGAEIFAADNGFHNYALSCMSVRRMSARAIWSL